MSDGITDAERMKREVDNVMRLSRFVQGIRADCPTCKIQVTPYMMIESDDVTSITKSIDFVCPGCSKIIRKLI
jgi:hypothetical protein